VCTNYPLCSASENFFEVELSAIENQNQYSLGYPTLSTILVHVCKKYSITCCFVSIIMMYFISHAIEFHISVSSLYLYEYHCYYYMYTHFVIVTLFDRVFVFWPFSLHRCLVCFSCWLKSKVLAEKWRGNHKFVQINIFSL
jgi:hypothetical protein